MMKTFCAGIALLVLLFTMAISVSADFEAGSASGTARLPASQAPLEPQQSAQKRIEIILSTQHLVAWEDERVAFEFAVTTGREGQETLTGDFEILNKEADAYSHAWRLALPFWLGIYQVGELENGFHALPITPDGNELWGDALGIYPASHGCIVLSPADAQALFEWVGVGTPVTIRD